MTSPATVGFAVDAPVGWLDLPLDRDPQAWAAEIAAGLRPDGAAEDAWLSREVLTSQLLLLAEQVQRTRPAAAFAHLPQEAGPDLVVEVLLLDLHDGTDLEDVVEEVVMPAEQQVDAAQREDLASPAGTAVRVRQRWQAGPERVVLDTTSYLWPVPDQRAALLMTSTTGDLVAAERGQQDLDDLARSLRLVSA